VSTTGVATTLGMHRERQLLLDADSSTIDSAPDTRLPVDAIPRSRGSCLCHLHLRLHRQTQGVVVPHRASSTFSAAWLASLVLRR